MTKRSTYMIAIALVILFNLSACAFLNSNIDGEQRNRSDPEPSNLEGTSWDLFAFRKTRPIEGTHFTLTFEDDQVRGNAGCNSYFGTYEVNGNQIVFSQLGMTEMACMEPEGLMEQEQYLLAFLSDGERFELKDGQLFIYRADGEALSFDSTE